jgi:hypothetical protein
VLLIETEEPVRAGAPYTPMLIAGHPILTELHVPNTGLRGWDGHHLWLLGPQVERPAPGAPWWGFDLVHGPVIGSLVVELREIGAFRPTSPLFTILRWSPGQPIVTCIEERGDKWTARDLKLAGAALPRIRGIANATGRPLGSGEFPDEPSFRAKVEPIVREMLNTPGGQAKIEDVAAKLERSPRDLSRLCSKWTGGDWPTFVASIKS